MRAGLMIGGATRASIMVGSTVAISVLATSVLAASIALLSWPAQAAPKPDQRVTVTGCPFAGVTASCLMIKGSDGTVYNITGVSPKPRVMDRMIRLRGAVTDKASMCNQGIVLDRIRWTRTRQRCSN
jgi:hypothetical protein